MNYQEALETIGKTYTDDCQQICEWEEYELLQELIDKCVFINEEWKTKNNVQGTFLIETPTDRTCLPQGVDYE